MHFTDLVRADAKIYSQAVPRFLPTLSRGPKTSKRKRETPTMPKKRPRKTSGAKLSELNAATANAIFKLHDLETTSFTSVFLLMKLDLKIMFPELPCFVEERPFLSWIGRPPSPDESYGAAVDCPVISERLKAIAAACRSFKRSRKEGALCPTAFATAKNTWREFFAPEFPENGALLRGQSGFAAQQLEAKLLSEKNSIPMVSNNQLTHTIPFKCGADIVFVDLDLATRPTVLYRPALVQP